MRAVTRARRVVFAAGNLRRHEGSHEESHDGQVTLPDVLAPGSWPDLTNLPDLSNSCAMPHG